MTHLSLTLLGTFQARQDGLSLSTFRTKASQALLIYLAAQPDQGHNREKLMTLLWPGMPQKSAQANLRQTLYLLRQVVPEAPASEGIGEPVALVIANRQEMQINPAADLVTDTVRFEELLDRVATHQHMDLMVCAECHQNLSEAVGRYQDHFLVDFYLEDSNEFEDWAQARREHYRRKVLDALETLTTIAFRRQAFAEGQALAERQLEIDNLRKSAYRQLMEILAHSGRSEEALSVYERCRRFLVEELGMEPSARTSELYARIQAEDLTAQPPVAQGCAAWSCAKSSAKAPMASFTGPSNLPSAAMWPSRSFAASGPISRNSSAASKQRPKPWPAWSNPTSSPSTTTGATHTAPTWSCVTSSKAAWKPP